MADNNHHRRAQDLSAKAAALLARGDRKKAHELFAVAADLEREAFDSVPIDRARTRGILAVSTASLFYKARKLSDAQKFLFAVLASENGFLAPQESQLRELLEVVWDELSLPAGAEYAPNQIDVALRGGSVGFGTAPLWLALAKADEIMKLVVRFGEFLGKMPLRTRGAAPPDLLDLVQARVTQPVPGSYRFSIKLVEPAQQEMFDDKQTLAASITPLFFEVLRASTSTSPIEKAKLKQLVPDDGYRQTMVKLLRNVVPTDGSLREVELSSAYSTEGKESVRESVVLFKEVKETLNAVLRAETPERKAEYSTNEDGTISGVLRALHLNDRWLVVVDDRGIEQRCETGEGAVDDVIGPMVNRRVEVRGRWETRSGKRILRMIDIEPAA